MGTDRQDAEGRLAPAPTDKPHQGEAVDLDRLVWDPEYRAAVRPLLRRAG